MIYDRDPLNSDYVIDYTRQTLIFAVGTEVKIVFRTIFQISLYLASSLCL